MKEKLKRKVIIHGVILNSMDVVDFRNRNSNIVHPTFLEFRDILSIVSSDILAVKIIMAIEPYISLTKNCRI